MTTQVKALAAAIALAVAVVLFFAWKHDADARRDGQIAMLDADRDTLHHQIDSLTKHSLLMDALVAQGVESVTVHDTAWKRHSDTVPTLVEHIVHDTVADSTKIRELAALVIETKAKGDSLSRAVDTLLPAVIDLRHALTDERAARDKDRSTATTEIGLLKKQSRRWGLGASLGYDPAKVDWRKPRLNVGLVVRY